MKGFLAIAILTLLLSKAELDLKLFDTPENAQLIHKTDIVVGEQLEQHELNDTADAQTMIWDSESTAFNVISESNHSTTMQKVKEYPGSFSCLHRRAWS